MPPILGALPGGRDAGERLVATWRRPPSARPA